MKDLLILNGHIDVVPVGAEELWSNQPFAPVIRDAACTDAEAAT